MDNMLPLPQAAELGNMTIENLNQLIRSNIIRAVKFSGEIVVSEEDVLSTLPKVERPEYKAVAHLVNNPIGVREAGRKYSIPDQTISRWAKQGIIKKLGQKGQKVMLDEADVAYCAKIYHANSGQGKWLFNPDGTPYRKVN